MKQQELALLKDKKENELISLVANLKKEVTKLRLEMALRKVKNVSLIGQKKKDIARILTMIKERNLPNG